MVDLDRRAFLKLFAASSGCYAFSAASVPFISALACADTATGIYHFPQGLASGDPQSDAIILWTRVAPVSHTTESHDEPINIHVQVSETEDFATLLIERSIRASPVNDHTVRIYIADLKPDTRYFYRFRAGTDFSALTGRTRTAPTAENTRSVNYAFVSCQNFEQGYFSALRRLVNDDIATDNERQIEFVLHLGDFIYEHTGDVPETETPTRQLGPLPDGSVPWVPDGTRPWWQSGGQAPETVRDYRFLYKTYLSDPDLQAARARFPFIHTWDDHEFTNDAWQSHDTYFGDGEPAQPRKVAANQAWFEFIPALLSEVPAFFGLESAANDFKPTQVYRSPMGQPDGELLHQGADNLKAINSMTIYRAFSWGALLDLIITDLRSYRSQPVLNEEMKAFLKGAPVPPVRIIKLLDAGRIANEGSPPATLEYAERSIENPRVSSPPGTHMGGPQKKWFKQAMKNSTARWRIWGNSVPALSMRLDFSNLPFVGLENGYLGTDAWQGYPSELNELMKFLRDEKINNVISCTGDYHAHAAGLLPVDPDAEKLEYSAVEIATCAISSGSMFSGAERISRSNDFFRHMVVIEDGDTIRENFNNTVVNGLRSGILTNYTNSPFVGNLFRNERASPGLCYLDSNAHGFALVAVHESRVDIELVNVGDVTNQAGSKGPPVLRRTRFSVPSWSGNGSPALEGPTFDGIPSFPYGPASG
tara:strand:+ start:112444 stop:114558 length:2115 start_codon:yes stop_codon:yes gene_type:complete